MAESDLTELSLNAEGALDRANGTFSFYVLFPQLVGHGWRITVNIPVPMPSVSPAAILTAVRTIDNEVPNYPDSYVLTTDKIVDNKTLIMRMTRSDSMNPSGGAKARVDFVVVS